MGEARDTRYATPRLRGAVTRLLSREIGSAPATAETLAAVSARVLDTLSLGLARIIGPAGVRSILLRAVQLQKSEFAFLDERIVPSDSRESVAEPLRACLQEQEPEVIREVSVTLIATFAGLLANIIGDRLMWSLLQQIWPDALPPRTERQETEE